MIDSIFDDEDDVLEGEVGSPMDSKPILHEELPFNDDLEMAQDLVDSEDIVDGGHTYALSKKRQIKLGDMNATITRSVAEIKSKRLLNPELVAKEPFSFTVEEVRLFGQYCATMQEMAAYFGTSLSTIAKVMSNDRSDFAMVFNKAKSLTHMSIRQSQLKSALNGSEKMQMFLGKVELKQTEAVDSGPRGNGILSDKEARRERISQLRAIEIWDDEEDE